jgi:hypothetical protein
MGKANDDGAVLQNANVKVVALTRSSASRGRDER